MGFIQSILQLATALLILSLIGINAQGSPVTHLLVDDGCVSYRDHILDVNSWACAGEGFGGIITMDSDSNYHVTVFTRWFSNPEHPPKLSRALRQNTFQWNGYKGDVSVTAEGCLHTAQASNQAYEQIGTCPAGKFLGPRRLVLNPYWQKLEFLQRNLQFKNPADDNTSEKYVSVPDGISSPDLSTPEISSSGQTPSIFETGQDFDILPANGGSDTSYPLSLGNGLQSLPDGSTDRVIPDISTPTPVADFFSSPPNGRLAGQDYTFSDEFTIERRRKQQRRRRVINE